MFVGGIVVGDQVDIQMLGRGGVDPAQELEPFLMTMSRHALADHLAGGNLERGEQRGGAMPFVIMGHGSAAALLHRQAGLRAIERLDLENTSALSGGLR